MKKGVFLAAGFSFLLSWSIPAGAFAETGRVSVQHHLTAQQVATLESVAVTESGAKQASVQATLLLPGRLPSPYETSPEWAYSGLGPQSYIDTSDAYAVSATEQAYLTVKQYNNSNPVVTYQLVNISGGSNSSPVTLTGLYQNSYAYVYFNNVSPGTYVLRIYNPTTYETLDGLGYTHYY